MCFSIKPRSIYEDYSAGLDVFVKAEDTMLARLLSLGIRRRPGSTIRSHLDAIVEMQGPRDSELQAK